MSRRTQNEQLEFLKVPVCSDKMLSVGWPLNFLEAKCVKLKQVQKKLT